MANSKFKALLKKAVARTIKYLQMAVADARPRLTPTDCHSYFAKAGYGNLGVGK